MKNGITEGSLPKTLKSGIVAFSAAVFFAGSAHAVVTLTGIYDPASANDVDRNAAFQAGGGSVGTTAANVLDVSTFTTSVSTAFSNGLGGVINFDQSGDSLAALTSPSRAQITTNTFGGRTLSFTIETNFSGSDDFRILTSNPSNRTATSGTSSVGGVNDYVFTEFNLSGGDPGDLLTQFGLALIDRTNVNASWSGSAVFSDGSTLQFATSNFTSGNDDEDTFYGVVAPTGTSITQFRINSSQFSILDDFGFVVTAVPEPSSLALFGLGGIALALRRCRS